MPHDPHDRQVSSEEDADLAFFWSTRSARSAASRGANDRQYANLPFGLELARQLTRACSATVSATRFPRAISANGYAAKYKVDHRHEHLDHGPGDDRPDQESTSATVARSSPSDSHRPAFADAGRLVADRAELTGYHVLTIEKYNDQGRRNSLPGHERAGRRLEHAAGERSRRGRTIYKKQGPMDVDALSSPDCA